jgi:serine O-acetyltransferase
MTLRRTLALIASDYRRMADHYGFPLTLSRVVGITILPAMYGLIIHRVSHLCHARGLRFLAWPLYSLNIMLTGLDAVPSTEIGERCLLGHTIGTVISGRIGRNATLLAKVGIGGGRGPGGPGNERGLPIVGDDVTVGVNSTIMGPITIGDGAVIGGHSMVIRDVPPLAVVVGVPSRVLRYRASTAEPAL